MNRRGPAGNRRRAALLVVTFGLGVIVWVCPIEVRASAIREEYGGPATRVPPITGHAALSRPREYRSLYATRDPRDTKGPLDIAAASFGQKGRELVVGLRTYGSWSGADLRGDSRRSLCVYIFQSGSGAATARVCVTRARSAQARGVRLKLEALDSAGAPRSSRLLKAKVRRPDGRSLQGIALTSEAGLARGRYGWQARSTWVDAGRCATDAEAQPTCTDMAPGRGPAIFRLARVRPLGCVPRRPARRLAGPRRGRVVAVTFDDGPGPYTPRVLRILERHDVPATFFLLGAQIRAREQLLRRMVRDGDAVGNHSYNHANLAGDGPGAYRQMAATSGRIRRASAFTPCLFRPPYGAVSGSLVSEALGLGMQTILWDVDPRDWSLPGAGAIRARVLRGVRPGSIVLLHDAGGPRGQTVTALPAILAKLRARGYRFVTVPELLSLREIYG